MRFTGLVVLAVLATLAVPPLARAADAKPQVTAIKAARLFDGKGDAAVANGVVIVEGTRITAVGSGILVPAGAGNPLTDIHATERVRFVMKGGRVYRNDAGNP